MVAGEDSTYSLKVTFTDKETADWADGKVAFKVAYGVGGMVANEFWWGDNGNNVVVEPGEYTITFDPATGIVAVKLEYKIAGGRESVPLFFRCENQGN